MSAPVQAAMMSLAGRESITEQTCARLLATGLGEFCPEPVLYYTAPNGRPGPRVPGWRVERSEYHRDNRYGANLWTDFQRALLAWDPSLPALFFEDDLWPCKNAVRRMATVEAPRDAGVISFFDHENLRPRPGLFAVERGTEFNGSQCLGFPSHAIARLQELVRRPSKCRVWDHWIGQACDELGFIRYDYAPSLVQHMGMWSAYAPGMFPPTARNYPGQDFDAMGPCPDPIVEGPAPEPQPISCDMHGVVHPNGGRCAMVIR